nr:hypothetical protein [Moraxella equi]
MPISRLAECVTETVKDIEIRGMSGPVGNGNFHVLLLVDMDDEREVVHSTK